MITLTTNKFDILNITSELDLKVGGIKELSSPAVLEELASAVFTVGSKAFVKAMNLEAKGKPKQYHHVYEWQQLGTSKGRLFFLWKESVSGGKLVVRPGFIQSRTKVPVAPELLSPGRTGKSVAARHIFRDKASIMESGKAIIFRTSKPTPMPDNGHIRFVAAGTIIKNYNPGGKQVKGSFERYFKYWFGTKLDSVVNASGIIQAIDVETAKVLNNKKAGPQQVRTAIINLLKQYSKDEYIV